MMKSIFNFSRFGRYLTYDLHNAGKKYGLSLLLLGLTPVIFYFFYQVFHLIISGGFAGGNSSVSVAAYIVSVLSIIFSFPVKTYGFVTDKRSGADWTLIPASSFEKWLSMILISCFLLPLLFSLIFFGSDALLSLFISSYGSPLASRLCDADAMTLFAGSGVNFNLIPYLYFNFLENILVFLLGAIFFKNSKVAKTFICYISFSILLSIVIMLVIGKAHIGPENLSLLAPVGAPDTFLRNLKLYIACFYAIFIGTLAFLCFLRVQRIKH